MALRQLPPAEKNIPALAQRNGKIAITNFEQEHAPPQKPKRLHLGFLDGLRGFAALYVVLFHVVANGKGELLADTFLLNFLRFGHEAVVVFIVLSGFVLALPVSRSPQLAVSGGLSGFFKRRARRILPAYYAALFMLPLFFFAIKFLKYITGEGTNWNRITDNYINADMLSHLFLLHNLSPAWSTSINPVLWSLSTEWWIYFVFALILLPIWRRFGVFKAVLVSIVLGLVPTVMHLLDLPTLAASPHLLGAFGLGMLSAALLFSDSHSFAWHKILKVITPLVFIAFCFISIVIPSIRSNSKWFTDFLVAIVCATFILFTAAAAINENKSRGLITTRVIQILESRPLSLLGRFSYSLYLTHLVVWAMLGITLNLAPVKRLVDFSLGPMPIRILILIPLLLISAYVFYLLFEKPFLRHRK